MYPDYQKICEERHGGLPASEMPFRWTHHKTVVSLLILAFAIPSYFYFVEQVRQEVGRGAGEAVLVLLRCIGIEIKP
jgi:hypothetical protein